MGLSDTFTFPGQIIHEKDVWLICRKDGSWVMVDEYTARRYMRFVVCRLFGGEALRRMEEELLSG